MSVTSVDRPRETVDSFVYYSLRKGINSCPVTTQTVPTVETVEGVARTRGIYTPGLVRLTVLGPQGVGSRSRISTQKCFRVLSGFSSRTPFFWTGSVSVLLGKFRGRKVLNTCVVWSF